MILKLRTHQKTQPNLIKYAKKNSRELLADIELQWEIFWNTKKSSKYYIGNTYRSTMPYCNILAI